MRQFEAFFKIVFILFNRSWLSASPSLRATGQCITGEGPSPKGALAAAAGQAARPPLLRHLRLQRSLTCGVMPAGR